MGRKRTSNKENIIISVDKDIIEKLRKLQVNRSALFTKKAIEYLESIEDDDEIEAKN